MVGYSTDGWSYEQRTWLVWDLWAANFINFGFMSNELFWFWTYEQWTCLNPWAYVRQTWWSMGMWASKLTNLSPISVQLCDDRMLGCSDACSYDCSHDSIIDFQSLLPREGRQIWGASAPASHRPPKMLAFVMSEGHEWPGGMSCTTYFFVNKDPGKTIIVDDPPSGSF